MNRKMKLYKSLFLLLLGSTVVASEGTQILYSINMPGNPFQQPYYQMMIKTDNENRVYPFSATNLPHCFTNLACSFETGCGSYWDDPSMNATSDYVSLYGDPGVTPYEISIMYGLSPYVFRGYMEGAASKLYMQRPAQVQLPFNPLVQIQSQNGGTASPVNATLPDYSDVFLAQTAANLYNSLGCANNIYSMAQGKEISPCAFSATNAQMPSWYTYIPRDSFWRGSSVIFYGTMASLAKPNRSNTSFSPYNEATGWSTRIAMGVSQMSSTYSVIGSTGWVLPKGVFSANGWLSSYSSNSAFGWNFPLVFAPIVSPGYAGDAKQLSNVNGYNNPVCPLATVLATGDLSGNYSVSNTSNSYIAAGNPVTTYDGISIASSGMSYFQLFAQNMQWFALQAPLQTPLVPFATPQNITPGQGIFSDTIQLAAMQAPASISKVPVFTGSVGVTAGITGPVMMDGAAPVPGGKPINFNIPRAFLSELTLNSFKVGRYLQVPLGTQMNGTWSGGLVQSASEDPLQYYQGVTPLESRLNLMPYLPVYSSDPGRPVDQPGWNYCPLANFNETSNAQMCYDTAASPMTNFYRALNGTR